MLLAPPTAAMPGQALNAARIASLHSMVVSAEDAAESHAVRKGKRFVRLTALAQVCVMPTVRVT